MLTWTQSSADFDSVIDEGLSRVFDACGAHTDFDQTTSAASPDINSRLLFDALPRSISGLRCDGLPTVCSYGFLKTPPARSLCG